MAIRSDKNIEALRIGIAEQERKRLDTERIDALLERLRKRIRVEGNIITVPAIALLEGDQLVASDDGTSFYVAGTVLRVARTTEEGKTPARDWWVSVRCTEAANGSTYGTALSSDQRVLVVDNTAGALTRREQIRLREEDAFAHRNDPVPSVRVASESVA